MFCSKCGIENTEGAAFCKNCGNRLGVAPAPEAAPAAQEAPVYTAPAPVVKPPLSSHPVLNAVKKIASSPLFLVAVIAYSAQLLFSLINLFKGGNAILSMIYRILDMMGGNVPYEFYEIIDRIAYIGRAPVIIFGFLGLIPTMLICAGLWMTYASAQSRMSNGMKTAGLTMIKVLTIIQLIGSCIAVVVIELLLLIAVIGIAATEYAPGAAIAVMVFVVLVVAASYTLQIIYSAKIIKSLNAAKNTIMTGVPAAKASAFVAIWAFISAFGALFSLVTSFLSSAAAITSLVCFGILVFKYNNSMRAIAAPSVTPQYVAPVE